MYRQKFQKHLVNFLEQLAEKFCWFLIFHSLLSCRKSSHFESRKFQDSLILASCNLAGRTFIACNACTIVFVHANDMLLIAIPLVNFDWLFVV